MNTQGWYRWSLVTCIIFAFAILSVSADVIPLASVSDSTSSPSASAGGDSYLPIISADGRYVIFSSTAKNLTVANNNPAAPPLLPANLNVFLRDRTNGTTSLISVNIFGAPAIGGDSIPRAVSTNGQFVLFESAATNLVANNTNIFGADVYVRDIVNGTTQLISVSTNGGTPNGNSGSSVMTPDGRYVAFSSTATNLVIKDTNGLPDIFVRDLMAGTTALASVGAILNVPAGQSGIIGLTNICDAPAITPDGRYVVFYSSASNLVANVKTYGEIYERDLVANTTICVSTNARNQILSPNGSTNYISCNPKVSDDGNFIAFEACTNPPSSTSARGFIFRYNRQTQVTDTIYTNANVPTLPFEQIHSLDLTPNGRFIAFVGNVTGFDGSDSAIFLWDAQTGSNTIVSANNNGVAIAGIVCDSPAVATNGQSVAFIARNPITVFAPTSTWHLYLRNMVSGVTLLLDTNSNGAGMSLNPTTVPSLSADGKTVAFESADNTLVANDHNRAFDIFVRDTTLGQTELISSADSTLASTTPDGSSGNFLYSVSGNGRYVAFASEADNLAPNDTNNVRDVFARDLLTGSNMLVSVATNGFSGAGISTEPSISGDGRYVAFSSYALNLVAGINSSVENVYVRDLQAGTTILVSATTVPNSTGNSNSFQPTISSDGRLVLFRSQSSNLTSPPTDGHNFFLRDLQLNQTYPIGFGNPDFSAAMTPDGHFIVFNSNQADHPTVNVWDTEKAADVYSVIASGSTTAISQNGRLIAYAGPLPSASTLFVTDWSNNISRTVAPSVSTTHPGVHFSGDGQYLAYATGAALSINDLNGTNDVYVYNYNTGSNTLVSFAFNSTNSASAASDSPTITADGRFIIYRSTATNLVATGGSGIGNLYVYDQQTGTNALLTQSRLGNFTADHVSHTPVASADGHTIVFQSYATDLANGDFNANGDMFAFSFFYVNAAPVTLPSGAVALNWPVVPGKTYQVQYKNNLSDALWQNLNGIVSIMGNQAFLTNAAPSADQQFYRVIGF